MQHFGDKGVLDYFPCLRTCVMMWKDTDFYEMQTARKFYRILLANSVNPKFSFVHTCKYMILINIVFDLGPDTVLYICSQMQFYW